MLMCLSGCHLSLNYSTAREYLDHVLWDQKVAVKQCFLHMSLVATTPRLGCPLAFALADGRGFVMLSSHVLVGSHALRVIVDVTFISGNALLDPETPLTCGPTDMLRLDVR